MKKSAGKPEAYRYVLRHSRQCLTLTNHEVAEDSRVFPTFSKPLHFRCRPYSSLFSSLTQEFLKPVSLSC